MNELPFTRPLRILAVDDSRETADLWCHLLGFWGHHPFAAYDAATALETALREHPDVVFLDLSLTGSDMDGWELARRLRAEPALGGVVLIALSGHESDADRQKSVDAGIDEHLVKPIDPDVLRGLLAAGLWADRDAVDQGNPPAPTAAGEGR
jgi:CheY-like chemotaxis protein